MEGIAFSSRRTHALALFSPCSPCGDCMMGYRYSQPLICNSPFSPLKLIKSIGFTSYFVRLINEGGFVQPLVAGLGIFRSLDCTHAQARFAHKFAAPECPNLLKLRKAIEQNFKPICFYVKNDYAMGHHVYDQHFYVRAHAALP